MRNRLKYQGSKEYAAPIYSTLSLYKATLKQVTYNYRLVRTPGTTCHVS
jgi:hypothetical protein